MATTRRQRQRAWRSLYAAYRGMLDQVTEAVVARAEEGDGTSFDFAWQELEDRYAMRVQHLQILLGALEGASRPPTRTRRWVSSFVVAGDELDDVLNHRLAERVEDDGDVEDVSVLPAPGGEVRVVLRYKACVPLHAAVPVE